MGQWRKRSEAALTMALVLAVMSVIDVMALRDPMRVDSYLQAMLVAAKVFLGLPAFSYYKYN